MSGRHPIVIDPDVDLNDIEEFSQILPQKMKESFQAIPKDYFDKTDKQLLDLAFFGRPDHVTKDEKKQFGEYPDEATCKKQLNLYRHLFWEQKQRFVSRKSSYFSVKALYQPISSEIFFYNNILKDPAKLAYIMRPPPINKLVAKLIIDEGYSELYRYVKKGTIKPNGLPDHKAAENILKIVSQLEDRIYGSPTQRIQQTVDTRSVSVNIDGNNSEVKEKVIKSISTIEQELKALERRADTANNALSGDVITEDAITSGEDTP